LQYVRWNNKNEDAVFRRKLNWDQQGDYTSMFYSCDSCILNYKKQFVLIVNRTNKYTGKKYSQDPAIMSWVYITCEDEESNNL
jgi:mannan endo-1,4-beta-mannosidase